MAARTELAATAAVLGWSRHSGGAFVDSYLRADRYIISEWRADGALHSASLYRFYRIDHDLELLETTGNRGKKAKMLGWLAR